MSPKTAFRGQLRDRKTSVGHFHLADYTNAAKKSFWFCFQCHNSRNAINHFAVCIRVLTLGTYVWLLWIFEWKYFLWSYTSPPWISSLIAEAILLVGQPEKVVLHVYRWLSSYDFEPEKAVINAKSMKDINALPVILSSYDFWEDARSRGMLSS